MRSAEPTPAAMATKAAAATREIERKREHRSQQERCVREHLRDRAFDLLEEVLEKKPGMTRAECDRRRQISRQIIDAVEINDAHRLGEILLAELQPHYEATVEAEVDRRVGQD